MQLEQLALLVRLDEAIQFRQPGKAGMLIPSRNLHDGMEIDQTLVQKLRVLLNDIAGDARHCIQLPAQQRNIQLRGRVADDKLGILQAKD